MWIIVSRPFPFFGAGVPKKGKGLGFQKRERVGNGRLDHCYVPLALEQCSSLLCGHVVITLAVVRPGRGSLKLS